MRHHRSLTATAAALALGLGAAARAEQELPTYPGTVHTRIGNDLVIGGEYYRIAYFLTPDPVAKVADYFVRQWRDQGYPTTVDGDPRTDMVVSAFYTREGLQRSVVLRVHEGKTLGFTVLRDLWVQPAPADPKPGMVRLEGTLFSEQLTARDAPGHSAEQSGLVGAGLPKVREDLLRKLEDSGFRLVKEAGQTEGGKKRLILDFVRGKDQVLNVLTEIDPAMTAVMQTWVGSDHPEARKAAP